MKKIKEGFQVVFQALPLTFKSILPFTKQNLGLILTFSILIEVLQHYFLFIDRLTSGNTSLNLPSKIGLALSALLSLVFYQMLVPLRLQKNASARNEAFFNFVKRKSWPFLLENLRALARILLIAMAGLAIGAVFIFLSGRYGPVLPAVVENGNLDVYVIVALSLLPATILYIRYSFVPYIVLVDPIYEQGNRNPLKHSYELMRGLTLILLLIFLGLFYLESLRTGFREEYSLLARPFEAILLYLPFEAAGICINILLFYIYQLKQNTLDS